LRSAFRVPPPVYCRNPPMTSYQFTRTTATFQKDGSVVFETDKDLEEGIEVADDWLEGKEAIRTGLPHEATGYVGEGFSKYGIYARFQGKEYVMGQLIDDTLTAGEALGLLEAEYKILCQRDGFKARFDDHAQLTGVSVPSFYFNFKGSILGELIVKRRSEPRNIAHVHFIATPLLPCGKADSKVQKFTGNNEAGPATDDITKAIHAFAHFSLVYSHEHLVFCDLQGNLTNNLFMCLIDPQAHTNLQNDLYWDGGAFMIGKFKKQHLEVCSQNWVCKRLLLEDVEVTNETSETVTPSPPQKKKKARANLKYDIGHLVD
ncbi:kinase-like domain-containing protein, partial [Amanita rubescens]